MVTRGASIATGIIIVVTALVALQASMSAGPHGRQFSTRLPPQTTAASRLAPLSGLDTQLPSVGAEDGVVVASARPAGSRGGPTSVPGATVSVVRRPEVLIASTVSAATGPVGSAIPVWDENAALERFAPSQDPLQCLVRLWQSRSRTLATPAVCSDRMLCEALGRMPFTAAAPEPNSTSSVPVPTFQPDLTFVADSAVRRAREFAAARFGEWASANKPSTAVPADRRLPFFPFYTALRGLGGARLLMQPNGSFTFDNATAESALPLASPWASLHAAMMRRGTDAPVAARGNESLTTIAMGNGDEYHVAVDKLRRELEERFRMDLSDVPVPVYLDTYGFVEATAGGLSTEIDPCGDSAKNASSESPTLPFNTRTVAGEAAEALRSRWETVAYPVRPVNGDGFVRGAVPELPVDSTVSTGLDYARLPPAAAVLNGSWPFSHLPGARSEVGFCTSEAVRDLRPPQAPTTASNGTSAASVPLADARLGLPEWTRHAQMVIQRSQRLPMTVRHVCEAATPPDGNTTATPAAPCAPGAAGYVRTEVKRQSCRDAKLLVSPLLNYGLGAAVRLAAVTLGHAMISGRQFVFHPRWKRWAGDNASSVCAALGWQCYFLPPSPCEPYSSGALDAGFASINQNSPLLSGVIATKRVVWLAGQKTKDLRIITAPHLLPPGVTPRDVTRVTGMKYHLWAEAQLVRYLLRGLQPWAELMVLQELRRAGYPWDEPGSGPARPVVATHYRNGDFLYNQEVRPVLKCGQLDTSLTVAVLEEVVWRLHNALQPKRPGANASDADGANATAESADRATTAPPPPECAVRHFVSFDHFRAVTHAEAWFAESAARVAAGNASADMLAESAGACAVGRGLRADVPVLNTSVTFRRGAAEDARTLMTRAFGKGHVMRASLGNLMLAAGADAWVNNDASNWAMFINLLRFTGGQGRHRALYVDLRDFAVESDAKGMQPFCNIVGYVRWERAAGQFLALRRDLQSNQTLQAMLCAP